MSLAGALEWLDIVGSQLPVDSNLKIVVCPDANCLEEVKKEIKSKQYPLLMGMQDLPVLDKNLASLAILGHSSRRQQGETDDLVAQKVKQVVEKEIIPLVCVQGSETLVPDGCKLIAYEPVFAIGTGNPDTPENAQIVAGKLSAKAQNLEILYGGSVNSENVTSFVSQSNICGVLIGKASLDASEFVRIIDECQHLPI